MDEAALAAMEAAGVVVADSSSSLRNSAELAAGELLEMQIAGEEEREKERTVRA